MLKGTNANPQVQINGSIFDGNTFSHIVLFELLTKAARNDQQANSTLQNLFSNPNNLVKDKLNKINWNADLRTLTGGNGTDKSPLMLLMMLARDHEWTQKLIIALLNNGIALNWNKVTKQGDNLDGMTPFWLVMDGVNKDTAWLKDVIPHLLKTSVIPNLGWNAKATKSTMAGRTPYWYFALMAATRPDRKDILESFKKITELLGDNVDLTAQATDGPYKGSNADDLTVSGIINYETMKEQEQQAEQQAKQLAEQQAEQLRIIASFTSQFDAMRVGSQQGTQQQTSIQAANDNNNTTSIAGAKRTIH